MEHQRPFVAAGGFEDDMDGSGDVEVPGERGETGGVVRQACGELQAGPGRGVKLEFGFGDVDADPDGVGGGFSGFAVRGVRGHTHPCGYGLGGRLAFPGAFNCSRHDRGGNPPTRLSTWR